MKNFKNSVAANILKANSASEILRTVRTHELSTFDLTLALRKLANLMQKSKELLPEGEVNEVYKHVFREFHQLKLRDISNVLHSIRVLSITNKIEFENIFNVKVHGIILGHMENRSTFNSHSVQIYHELAEIDQVTEEYDLFLLRRLRNENFTLSFIDLKIILAVLCKRMSFHNAELIEICFQRLEEKMLGPGLVNEIIDLLWMIPLLKNRLNRVSPNNLLENLQKFLLDFDLTYEHIDKLSYICKVKSEFKLFSILNEKLVQEIIKHSETLKTVTIVNTLNLFPVFTQNLEKYKNTIFEIANQRLQSFGISSKDFANLAITLHMLGKLLEPFENFPITDPFLAATKIYIVSCKNADDSEITDILGLIKDFNLQKYRLKDLLKLLFFMHQVKNQEKIGKVQEFQGQIREALISCISEENIEVFSQWFYNTASENLKEKCLNIWELYLELVFQNNDKAKIAKGLLQLYRDCPKWHKMADKLALTMNSQEFSRFLSMSFAKAKNAKGLMHLFKKVPNKEFKDILTVISIMFEYSLLDEEVKNFKL